MDITFWNKYIICFNNITLFIIENITAQNCKFIENSTRSKNISLYRNPSLFLGLINYSGPFCVPFWTFWLFDHNLLDFWYYALKFFHMTYDDCKIWHTNLWHLKIKIGPVMPIFLFFGVFAFRSLFVITCLSAARLQSPVK